MSTSVIPTLIDALVTAARTALPSAQVYDGYGVTDDPGDFLMVGVEDGSASGPAGSAESRQSWPHVGHQVRDEEGDVHCFAVSWNGDGDQKAARDAAFAITAAVENLLRADPSLGIAAQVMRTGFGTSQRLEQDQDQHGAIALVAFDIHFQARI